MVSVTFLSDIVIAEMHDSLHAESGVLEKNITSVCLCGNDPVFGKKLCISIAHNATCVSSREGLIVHGKILRKSGSHLD